MQRPGAFYRKILVLSGGFMSVFQCFVRAPTESLTKNGLPDSTLNKRGAHMCRPNACSYAYSYPCFRQDHARYGLRRGPRARAALCTDR